MSFREAWKGEGEGEDRREWRGWKRGRGKRKRKAKIGWDGMVEWMDGVVWRGLLVRSKILEKEDKCKMQNAYINASVNRIQI